MIDLVSLIAIGFVVLALVKRRKLPVAAPPGHTDVDGSRLPPAGLRSPCAGKDGLHRPAAGPRRSMGALLAWNGSIWRAR